MTPAASKLTAQLLAETREELTRADAKANLVLAGAGVGIGALLAGMVAGDVTLTGRSTAVLIAAGIAISCLVTGVLALVAAVMPRTGRPAAGRTRYYADVAQYSSPDENRFVDALQDEAEDPQRRNRQQLLAQSKAVRTKFRAVKTALWLLLAGSAAAAVAGCLATP